MKQQVALLFLLTFCFGVLAVKADPTTAMTNDIEAIQDQASINVIGDKIEGGLESVENYFEIAPEDELKDLSEEHRMIKQDCLSLKTQIDQAISDGVEVDEQLQADYDQCQLDLAEVELDMQEVTAEMIET